MATQSFGVTVIRPDDLLLLRIDFVNVDLAPPAGGLPATINGQAGAWLLVQFQPQHVAEQAFWQAGAATKTTAEQLAQTTDVPTTPDDPVIPPPPGQVKSILAGPTRLVFTVPAGRSFPLTVEGVLTAIQELPLVVPPIAAYETPPGCVGVPPALLPLLLRPAPPKIARPALNETAIEVPFKLFLSPDSFGKWEHAIKKVEHDGRVELWHTRLGSRRAGGDPRVRAVWSPDYRDGDPQDHSDSDPFRSALDGRDRNEIVRLTSDYYIDFLFNYSPLPVATHRFMLTGLGAWLDVHGTWNPPRLSELRSLIVEEWRHRATMGRDHYVRVVYAGFLFPFRHRASLVKITERKLAFKDGGFIAYNFQRMFILVRERVRSYPDRDIPFRSIEITTLKTPDLAPPLASGVPGTPLQGAFWPSLPPEFQFDCIGTDWEGRQIAFTCPLIFVDKDAEGLHFQTVIDHYNALGVTDVRRCRPMLGQKIAFAPPSKPGDTTEETIDLTFGADNAADIPRFRPFMNQANTENPALKNLADAPKLTVEWEPTYKLQTGNQIANAGEVFLKVKPGPTTKFPHESSGGLITPDMTITTISRALGPMGGSKPEDMRDGKMAPSDVFAGVTLMGGITLNQIIKVIQTPNAADPDVAGKKLPQFLSVRDDGAKVIRTTYSWTLTRNELWDDRETLADPTQSKSVLLWRDSTSALKLTATLTKPFDPNAKAIFETGGEITNFDIVLLPPVPLARLKFNRISFRARTGEKLDTSVDFAGIEFDGILKFVNELQKVIPLDGFSDPPSVQLVSNPPGVNVGFSLGLPSIGVGIMTMQNVSLSAGFYLPFIGTEVMNFRFAFCERHQPFILTVSLFGGGGFFAINMGLAGVKSIEAALEFGASIALNLGVASGQASIMAGFYFKMEGKEFTLTGYFRACGALSVLGIITVSVEFYLGLSYSTKGSKDHPGKLWGQATLTVKIKIIFFSISVGVSLEREFAGSDPTFRKLMPPGAWEQYCDAFDDYAGVPGD